MARDRGKTRIYIPKERDKKDPSLIGILFMFIIPPLWPFGVLMILKLARNIWRRKKRGDYSNYAAMIGDRCELSLAEISATLNKSMAQVINDLQTMIRKGYMGPEAYIDHRRSVLVLAKQEEEIRFDPAPKEKVVSVVVEEKKQAETAKPERPAPKPQPQETFEEILRKMRALNDEIADETVSHDIDRIGELTSNIFGIVRAHPERREEVRKFMDYYLPTTFSLLESYALMEKQSYQSANILESRKKIESIMNKLVEAFEQQHDRMFRKDAMDVDAEISVLEKMLASDGLVSAPGADIHAEFERRRREGA